MPKLDLRIYKKEIRSQMRDIRRNMSPDLTMKKDNIIFRRVCALEEYRKSNTLVVYVSKELEVDTIHLIRTALGEGKKVAVPRCVENSRIMNMHLINSMEDLEKGSFGLLEPPQGAPILHKTRDALAIVPAFCNDMYGYRVGYGGGYYDRYLSSFQGVKVGINYSECVQKYLINGRYDVPIDLLVTDKAIFRFRKPLEPAKNKPQKHSKFVKKRGQQKFIH